MSSRSDDISDAITLRWHSYQYLPYEKTLAAREVESLLGIQPATSNFGMVVPTRVISVEKVARLTYFRDAVGRDGEPIETVQGLLERSSRAAASRDNHPRRQSTRYSAHGIHEYKGKFNPQVVRAIGNIFALAEDDWLFDPFCGSGTTLLEALHGGWNAVGTDLNPLAVEIANAKIAAMQTPVARLNTAAETLEAQIDRARRLLSHNANVGDRTINRVLGPVRFSVLPNLDYVSRWFPRPVLAQLAVLINAIDALRWPKVRQVFRVILSDILRDVSLQDPADLRIRRRKDAAANYPAIDIFTSALRRKLEIAARAQMALARTQTYQLAIRHDSRQELPKISTTQPSEFDAAITSPPYATALPYIDTQRLSLCILGLLDAAALAGAERDLIGTREITSTQRLDLNAKLEENKAELPAGVHTFLCEMLQASLRQGNGFRRQNTPGLIYKYFGEMQEVLRSVARKVRSSGSFALLVGRNKTNLGGKEFVIDTPAMLADIAQHEGWTLIDLMDLDTYQRYDLHHKNSIRRESLVILRKSARLA